MGSSSYQIHTLAVVASDRDRVSPRQATPFSCSCKQRKQKNTPLLSASLRFAPGNLRHAIQSAVRQKLAARALHAPLKHLPRVR